MMRRSTDSRPRRHARPLVPTIILTTALMSTGVGAQVFGFLDQGAVRYFRGDDTGLMSNNLTSVLDEPDDDASGDWRNAETGSYGRAVVEKAFEHQGMACRRVRITNHAGGIDDTSVVDMCKVEGAWKVLSLPE
jgi:hypothetical protein